MTARRRRIRLPGRYRSRCRQAGCAFGSAQTSSWCTHNASNTPGLAVIHRVGAAHRRPNNLAANPDLGTLRMEPDVAAKRHGHHLQSPATAKARDAGGKGGARELHLSGHHQPIVVGAERRAGPRNAGKVGQPETPRQMRSVTGRKDKAIQSRQVPTAIANSKPPYSCRPDERRHDAQARPARLSARHRRSVLEQPRPSSRSPTYVSLH